MSLNNCFAEIVVENYIRATGVSKMKIREWIRNKKVALIRKSPNKQVLIIPLNNLYLIEQEVKLKHQEEKMLAEDSKRLRRIKKKLIRATMDLKSLIDDMGAVEQIMQKQQGKNSD
ncbi:hypothetical protein CCZ01_09175 [Helicobacter monodelphidis]|uniref:hypothetical protein n=1 Tax=Helicobacter sp. 15-1451 TaxID=2004995 RepID=UPI000DCB1F5F|nr:hypothetical protein [Helicobacter sp. 15-1451]RAX56535.1 hypothetical protein CCZ01_09175 [Helicobacter sp. 15-1451]